MWTDPTVEASRARARFTRELLQPPHPLLPVADAPAPASMSGLVAGDGDEYGATEGKGWTALSTAARSALLAASGRVSDADDAAAALATFRPALAVAGAGTGSRVETAVERERRLLEERYTSFFVSLCNPRLSLTPLRPSLRVRHRTAKYEQDLIAEMREGRLEEPRRVAHHRSDDDASEAALYATPYR